MNGSQCFSFWVDALVLVRIRRVIALKCSLTAADVICLCVKPAVFWFAAWITGGIISVFIFATCGVNTNANAKHHGRLPFFISLTWIQNPFPPPPQHPHCWKGGKTVSETSRDANCPLGDVYSLNRLKMVTPLKWALRKMCRPVHYTEPQLLLTLWFLLYCVV